jgi:hypothetical protein
MKFTPKFRKNDIRNFITSRIEKLEATVFDQLQQIGEQFVADARTVDTYTDRTSNLRGSIGYVIVKDSKEVFGNFDGITTGVEHARQFIRKISGDYPKGYVLITVAGMNYAAAVESKGYDVITGSSQSAESNLTRAINRLKQALSKVK